MNFKTLNLIINRLNHIKQLIKIKLKVYVENLLILLFLSKCVFYVKLTILIKNDCFYWFICYLHHWPFWYKVMMLYEKIYLKMLVRGFSPMMTKLNKGFPMRFLNEILMKKSTCFFTRNDKSVLVDTLISIVKKLFVSKTVIFSI